MQIRITHLNRNITEVSALQYKIMKYDILIDEKRYKKEQLLKVEINGIPVFERIIENNDRYSRIEDFEEFKGKTLREKWTDYKQIKSFRYDSAYVNPYIISVYNKERDFSYEKFFRTLKEMKKFIDENLLKYSQEGRKDDKRRNEGNFERSIEKSSFIL